MIIEVFPYIILFNVCLNAKSAKFNSTLNFVDLQYLILVLQSQPNCDMVSVNSKIPAKVRRAVPAILMPNPTLSEETAHSTVYSLTRCPIARHLLRSAVGMTHDLRSDL